MFELFFDNCFDLNLTEYKNIGINLDVSKLLALIFVIMCVITFVINWHRGYMYLAVKQIFRHGAFGEDKAMTLKALGLSGSRSVIGALKRDSRLCRIISRKGEKKYTYEEYMKLSKKSRKPDSFDIQTAEFFVREENLPLAKNVYDNYSPSLLKTVFLCVLYLIIFVCLTIVAPQILEFIDGALAKTK